MARLLQSELSSFDDLGDDRADRLSESCSGRADLEGDHLIEATEDRFREAARLLGQLDEDPVGLAAHLRAQIGEFIAAKDDLLRFDEQCRATTRTIVNDPRHGPAILGAHREHPTPVSLRDHRPLKSPP